jgi:hypothetical protein
MQICSAALCMMQSARIETVNLSQIEELYKHAALHAECVD